MNAALHGHLEILEILVAAGADVNAGSDQGTALSWALFTDRRRCAEFLLRQGARTDARGVALRSLRNEAGYTPLMYAAMTELNDATMVEALLAKGVDANARETALEFARRRGDTRVVAALVRAGAEEGRQPSAGFCVSCGRGGSTSEGHRSRGGSSGNSTVGDRFFPAR